MEEKILQYERVKRSLQRHRGNIDLVYEETSIPKSYILDVRRKMPKELRNLPEEAKIYVAENTFWMIYDGVQERKQIIKDMLASLYRRERIIVCANCSTEIIGVEGKMLDLGMCPKCNKMVYRTTKERVDILAEKRALLKQDADEDERAERYASKLLGIKNPKVEVVTRPLDENAQQALPKIQGIDPEIAKLVNSMKPMDREMMMQVLLKRIMTLRVEVQKEEEMSGNVGEQTVTG